MTEQGLLNKLLAIFESMTGFVAQISSDHTYVHKGLA